MVYRSTKPNITLPNKKKPVFTPPAQNITKPNKDTLCLKIVS